MWIVLWDPVLKLDLLKFVLTDPVNSAQDPQKNAKRRREIIAVQSKLNLSIFFSSSLATLKFESKWKRLSKINKKNQNEILNRFDSKKKRL